MNSTDSNWDFFIAHAGADKAIAEDIYDRLVSESQVFLDSRCLELGDDWDLKLSEAQRASLVTLVLISANLDNAYYQRDEIAAAIALARAGSGQRVVPVYLNDDAFKLESVPYGLRLKHGLILSNAFGLDELQTALLELRTRLRSDCPTTEGDSATSHVVVDQSYQQDQWRGEPTLAAGYSSIRSILPDSIKLTVKGDGYGSNNPLKGIDVLILPIPYRTFVPDAEYREIVRWVQQGGGLLLLGFYLMEAHHQNNMNQLLRRVGMEFRRDLLMPLDHETFEECMAQSFAYQDSNYWIVSDVKGYPAEHAILSEVHKIALTSACSMECAEAPELLVETSEDVAALHVKGYKDPETGRIVRPTGYVLDRHGPGPFLSAMKYGKGRVIGIGTWKVFLNEFLDNESFDNSKLLRNSVNWLKNA